MPQREMPEVADDYDTWHSSSEKKSCSDSDEELQIIAPAPSATDAGFCDSCNESSQKEESENSGSEELEVLSPAAFSFTERINAYAHVLRRPGVPFPYVDYDPDNPSRCMTSTAEPLITDDDDSPDNDVCMGHDDDQDAGLDDSDSDSDTSGTGSSHCIEGGNGNGDNIHNDDDDEESNFAHSVGDLSTSVGSEQFSPSETDSDHTYEPLSETRSGTIVTTPKTSSKRSYSEI